MPLIEQNGEGLKYDLVIRDKNEPYSQIYVIDDWKISSYEMPVPDAYKMFEVQLWAKNKYGDAVESPDVYFLHSGEDGKKACVLASFSMRWDLEN